MLLSRSVLFAVLLMGIPLPAQEPAGGRPPETVFLRLNLGGGQATQDGARHGNLELGGDLLLSANASQRYGLRVSSLDLDVGGRHERYLCTGVVLEMVVHRWLRMEIGTVGFIGRGDRSGTNPFGLVSFVGYEKRAGALTWSIGYDSKYVFGRPAITVNNLGIGVGVHF
ncbi:hypothetical protein [Geothrix sp. 21YS21S-2]|uniref:hypothetical protein n=1 Tax=Geothrix sp. 21YS21S-2 TaxID=3068893 RepID=UPI0027B95427|nr:hypothetical protein [Geothrix sp. 21YS21S-2]